MNLSDICNRLDAMEAELLSLINQARDIKEDLQKEAGGNSSSEPLLSAEEVAKLLGVDTAYVYSQARAGKIPSIKLGKYRRFSPAQVRKWLEHKSFT